MLNLKRNQMFSSLTWETLARKSIKKQKRLVFRLRALFLLKTYFAFTLVQQQNCGQEKKSLLKFSFSEGTPRPKTFKVN